MTRRYIEACEGVPAPTSPISHAVVVGDLCWISGQHALDAGGHYVSGTAEEEATRCFELIVRIAEEAGFTAGDIAFVDIAFIDLADLAAVNTVFTRFFEPQRRPARTIYQAARLSFGAKLKVQAVAARSGVGAPASREPRRKRSDEAEARTARRPLAPLPSRHGSKWVGP